MNSPAVPPASPVPATRRVAIIGGGPAGLMAAEVLAAGGARVDVYDAMPTVGRKFLLAGKGGLNLTHSEALPAFVGRYGERSDQVASWLQVFGPGQLRDWVQGLGISTFVGSSGRVFPDEMKAAPLLRSWLQRLRASGVGFHMRHRWQAGVMAPVSGHDGYRLIFQTPAGLRDVEADAVLLGLGGASWSRLGSDGAWVGPLGEAGLGVSPLRPSNCGFDIGWSEHFASKHAGAPLKGVLLDAADRQGRHFRRKGECVVTATGLEGSLVYAASAQLRDEIEATGQALALLDLLPDTPLEALTQALSRGRGTRSLSNHLKEHAGLSGAKAGLLREGLSAEQWAELSGDAAWLARRIKSMPLVMRAARPVDEAISTAGGVRLEALDEHLMWPQRPGVFFAGEMLDWEAPTGGYLLTASFASGVVAARGALAWLGLAPAATSPAAPG